MANDPGEAEVEAGFYRLALQGIASSGCVCGCREMARNALIDTQVGERFLARVADLLHQRDDLRFEVWQLGGDP